MDGIQTIDGGVTAAKGFAAAAAAAGLKYEGRTDMALIYSDAPCHTAGVFTSNVVKAAPVLWDRERVAKKQDTRAVIVNSGIANACTGKEGLDCCQGTADAAAAALHIQPEEVLIGSTGVIAKKMPMDKLRAGIDQLAAAKEYTKEAGLFAAKAIMTTDTAPKQAAVQFDLNGHVVTVGGMSKGSGMIHPNMCTMLAFITTDLAISQPLLQEALQENVQDTFNMISVDGDTSTNDTLMVLANAQAGNAEICRKDEGYALFCEALLQVNTSLARQMAADGEGATALFTARIEHADTKEHARILARSVISSNLSKAAIFGHDANWGRFLCALGYAGVDFDPSDVDIYIEGNDMRLQLCKGGMATAYSEEKATEILSAPEVRVVADMHMGDAEAEAWGCDLSYDYVKINADYRS